jgi:serine/threonine protein kinase
MLMPPLVRKIEPGDVIGRCRTIRELGRGGVGTVYLAEHQTLRVEVALKVLSPALSLDNPALAERFIREAQLAARIHHPNVVAVMDAGHDEATGLYYIIMEFIGGGSLAWHLRNGPLPEKKALAIVTGIAHALVIAEENRIVHRDIKPENIMLDLRGTPKLADLGLAKHSLDSHVSLTLGGSFMGTPAYMSPEQARDAKVADTRDDIYSLGASFYECLTGEPPFQGETPYNIMSELLTKPSPRPLAVRPDLSNSADLICRKMMAKTRDLRYQDAHALLEDLQVAQTYGDSGLDQLDAASFEQDALLAREQRTQYGIETSSDGVYAGDDTPIESPSPVRLRPAPIYLPPSNRTNRDVFSAAALLIALVLVTTLLLAWVGPNDSLSFLKSKFATLMGQITPAAAADVPAKPKPAKEKEHTHTAAAKPVVHVAKPDETPPPAPTPKPVALITPTVPENAPPAAPVPDVIPVVPIAPSTDIPATTNAAPTDTNAAPTAPVGPVAALAVIPDSAFAARDIAEKTLDPAIILPGTGRAELLKIIGKRDDYLISPATWTFFFYDKSAAGHARIVTVNGGRVVKSGEDLVDFASPYSEQSILPEDKIGKDSSDALQIAQSLLPGVTVTGSEFALTQQKNSVPMWKVTLWTKANGEDHKLGDVTLLAENGTLISRNLKP